jgi:hypothetical protein
MPFLNSIAGKLFMLERVQQLLQVLNFSFVSLWVLRNRNYVLLVSPIAHDPLQSDRPSNNVLGSRSQSGAKMSYQIRVSSIDYFRSATNSINACWRIPLHKSLRLDERCLFCPQHADPFVVSSWYGMDRQATIYYYYYYYYYWWGGTESLGICSSP